MGLGWRGPAQGVIAEGPRQGLQGIRNLYDRLQTGGGRGGPGVF